MDASTGECGPGALRRFSIKTCCDHLPVGRLCLMEEQKMRSVLDRLQFLRGCNDLRHCLGKSGTGIAAQDHPGGIAYSQGNTAYQDPEEGFLSCLAVIGWGHRVSFLPGSERPRRAIRLKIIQAEIQAAPDWVRGRSTGLHSRRTPAGEPVRCR